MLNYFSNHMVQFSDAADTHRPCLIFRDGTVGQSRFHLMFGPRIISSFSWLEMTRIHLGFAMISFNSMSEFKKMRDGFQKMKKRYFFLLCF